MRFFLTLSHGPHTTEPRPPPVRPRATNLATTSSHHRRPRRLSFAAKLERATRSTKGRVILGIQEPRECHAASAMPAIRLTDSPPSRSQITPTRVLCLLAAPRGLLEENTGVCSSGSWTLKGANARGRKKVALLVGYAGEAHVIAFGAQGVLRPAFMRPRFYKVTRAISMPHNRRVSAVSRKQVGHHPTYASPTSVCLYPLARFIMKPLSRRSAYSSKPGTRSSRMH